MAGETILQLSIHTLLMQWCNKETGKKMLHGVDKSRMAKNGMNLIKFDKLNEEVV